MTFILKWFLGGRWASYPWDGVWRSRGGSGGGGWRARSLGAGGGSPAGTGCPHWSGTSRNGAKQTALWRSRMTSETEGKSIWIYTHTVINWSKFVPLMMVRRTHLHGLHHVKVGYVFVSELWMFWEMHVFFGHHDALFEEELIDSNAVLLGHQHLSKQTIISVHIYAFSKHLTTASSKIPGLID